MQLSIRNSLFFTVALLPALFIVVGFATAATTGSLMPTGEGNYLQWTPKTGTTHYTMVDEMSCNGTTDYNSTITASQRDSYKLATSSIPDGATITDIAIKPCASRNSSGSGSATLNLFYRFNGIDSADAGAYALPTGTTPVENATTTFSSLALDKTSTSTIEVGAVYTTGTKGIRLSRLTTVITYSLLTAPTSLSGTATTSSAIGLTWADNSTNEDAFAVERSPNGSSWTHIATTSTNAISYYDSGLSAGTTYYHRVRASNAGVYSAYTNTASTTTQTASPAAPSGLSSTATTSSAIGLAWTDNASNEDNFSIERSPNGSSWTHIATTSANAISYYDSGLAAGTGYYHRVRAWNTGGYSAYSNTSSATTTSGVTPPNAPSNGTAVASSTVQRIEVLWTDNSSDEDNFEVTRGTDGIFFDHLATTTVNVVVYTDLTVATSTTYYYKVRAYNSGGYSSDSNVSSTTTSTSPNTPSSLGSTASTTALRISLNWIDNSDNESSFRIERKVGTSSFAFLVDRSAGVTTYDDASLTAGSTYTYRVFARNGYGSSAYSNEASSTAATTPGAPTSLSGVATTTAVALAWTDNASNEISFDVQRSTNGISYSHIATTSANAVSYYDSGLATSTTYWHRVRAWNTIGFSVFSNVASTTTP